MRIKIFASLLFLFAILKVSAQSTYSVELNIKTEPTEKITKNETEIGFSFFKNIGSKNKISNTFKYKNTGIIYDLENYNLQDNLNAFSSFENKFEITHAINQKTNLNIEIKPTVNFEKNIGISDVDIFGGLEVSHSFNGSNSLSIGVKRAALFGKTEVLPTFSLTHSINKNTFVAIGFPDSQISYSNNSRNSFIIKNSFQGAVYNLDSSENTNAINATKMTYSQMATTFTYERNIDPNWSLNFKGGYGFNNKYYLTDNKGDLKYDFNNSNGYIFNIGIKFKH
ncbi:DUF6268 family outer membrane beta-barrel protein [Flavobacterium degerlachei]|jgi:hypothetical protein|uniref:Outer membrane protein beta-barrel domain-containing protein n=1 Tax=Flavobacterium degerlachei TaxID=229203 RepID=A0A1H3EIC7_9FLAO|nr:DUF6268 family outer membrane beta-barrel protein [Flavobacterium degerlachei]SDX78345.1 hypothetical protein SAMN05444338_11526 [Flavobacterium degerlachei]